VFVEDDTDDDNEGIKVVWF